jgi:tetratricopeptide (TPR) repeat protein
MKKIISIMFLLAITVSGIFAQTTAAEWLKKADEYFNSGDYTNAVKAYTETLKQDNSELNAYLFRGLSNSKLKNHNDAIFNYDIVIDAVPDFPTTYSLRGFSFGELGFYHKAVADYLTGLEKGFDPNSFNIIKSSKSDMWFCAAIFMEAGINRFLGKTEAVAKNENWLKTVCDKNKVSRQEVEKFYRDNARGLVSAIVNDEFNCISFELVNSSTVPQSFDFFLMKNPQNGQYNLFYKSEYTQNQTRNIAGNSFDDIVREMRNGKNMSDFNQKMIDDIRSYSSLIPAITYAEWKQKNVVGGVDALALITETLTNFCLDPTRANYDKAAGIYARYLILGLEGNDQFAKHAANSLFSTFTILNYDLSLKINNDLSTPAQRGSVSNVLGRDDRYKIFSTPYNTVKR